MAAYAFWIAPPPRPAAPVAPPTTPATAVAAADARTRANPAPGGPALASAGLSLWERLDQPDLADLIAALRRAGFPPSVVQAIARHRLERELAAFKSTIGYPTDTVGYWQKPTKPTRAQEAELSAFLSACDARLRAALGPDESASAARLAGLRERWGDFAPAKLSALEAIERDYIEIFSASLRDPTAAVDPGALYALLEKERNADLAAALGPDDYREYRLRYSTLAAQLRQAFGSAQLTEAEYRAIFQSVDAAIASGANQPVPLPPGLPPGILIRGGSINPELYVQAIGQLSAVLPPDRLADLQQIANPSAYQENLLVQRLGLPRAAATTMLSYRTEIQTLLQSGNTGSVTAEQQAAALARIQTIHDHLQSLLGPEGYAVLTTRNRGGYPTPAQAATAFHRQVVRRPGS